MKRRSFIFGWATIFLVCSSITLSRQQFAGVGQQEHDTFRNQEEIARLQRQHDAHLWKMRQAANDINLPPPVLGRTDQFVQKPVKDFVTITHMPRKLQDNFTISMSYQCGHPMMISVLVDGYENADLEFRNSSNLLVVEDPVIIARKSFRCLYSEEIQSKVVTLKIPKRFLYQPSLFMKKASMLEDVNLKGFMSQMMEWQYFKQQKTIKKKLHTLYERSKLKFSVSLTMDPPKLRSKFEVGLTPTWRAEILNKLLEKKPIPSYPDEECVPIVDYPVVLSEEPYGVIKTFHSFSNEELKRDAKRKVRMTLTVLMYLTAHCKKYHFCSIFHHVNGNDEFETPVLLMNQKGQIHLQATLVDGKGYALTTNWTVPINEWVKVEFLQANAMTNITLFYGKNFEEKKTHSVIFHKPVYFISADGYYVVGGTVYCKSINGIVARAKFCRNKRIESFEKSTKVPLKGLNLPSIEREQKLLKKAVKRKWKIYTDETGQCQNISKPYFLEMIDVSRLNNGSNLQCMASTRPLPERYSDIDKVLQSIPFVQSSEIIVKLRENLYSLFLEKMEPAKSIQNMARKIEILRQASLLGHGLSHYLLFVIYKNGIGTKTDLKKARNHLLLGAKSKDPLSLKALGHNHLRGNVGFQKDNKLSFLYYFNCAHKTQLDLLAHSENLATVNPARLSDERRMKEQLSEEDDMFNWFKHQATQGVFSAQRNLARLMYWGQQGLQRNLEKAFELYEEAAQGGDPVALYDYGLILMKGHGTNVNKVKAVKVLKQAAELKNPAALNTLGWYYSTQEVNVTLAKEYFEKAEALGSVDGTYNLGHMYHTGKFPGSKKDVKMAFRKYYKAGLGGHVEASLQVSSLMATGIKHFMPPQISQAIGWSRYLSERNPTMGVVIREGLQAYRRQSWSKALMMYLAAADAGYEVAQFNSAFLCEENKENLVVDHIEEECVWKNWNLTASVMEPHPYALNKMGDRYYYGYKVEKDFGRSLDFYGMAARLGFAQAMFNIACMLEKHGEEIDPRQLRMLNLPNEVMKRKEDIVIYLYRKCSDTGHETAMPCYIALLRTQFVNTFNNIPLLAKVISLAVIVISSVVVWVLQSVRHRDSLNAMNDIETVILESNDIETGEDLGVPLPTSDPAPPELNHRVAAETAATAAEED